MTDEQFTLLSNQIRDVKHALIGNDEMKTAGVKQDVEVLKKKMEDHEVLDQKNFNAIFNFQENQKLLLGWSRWTIGLIGTGLVMFGGLISWAATTIIAILK